MRREEPRRGGEGAYFGRAVGWLGVGVEVDGLGRVVVHGASESINKKG